MYVIVHVCMCVCVCVCVVQIENTPLHSAARAGHDGRVMMLLESDANANAIDMVLLVQKCFDSTLRVQNGPN